MAAVVRMRANRTHLNKAVQLHAFAGHGDEMASIAYAIERTELMRAGLKWAWLRQVGKGAHFGDVRRPEPHDRRAPVRGFECLKHHLNPRRAALGDRPSRNSALVGLSRSQGAMSSSSASSASGRSSRAAAKGPNPGANRRAKWLPTHRVACRDS